MPEIPINVIAAVCRPNRGIGIDGSLPWRLKGDMSYFRSKTSSGEGKQNAVVMGRKTWESIPSKFRPLIDRVNVVLSRRPDFKLESALVKGSLKEAIDSLIDVNSIWIIGGASLYEECIKNYPCKLYLTEIDNEFDCDCFFPEVDPSVFKETFVGDDVVENGITYRFKVYDRQESH